MPYWRPDRPASTAAADPADFETCLRLPRLWVFLKWKGRGRWAVALAGWYNAARGRAGPAGELQNYAPDAKFAVL